MEERRNQEKNRREYRGMVGGEALRRLSPRQLTWTYKYSTGYKYRKLL